MFDEEEDTQYLESEGLDRRKIARQELLFVMIEEGGQELPDRDRSGL
jgi:hypothetical protein